MRVFRINGDSLSLWFSPEGALSSAMLVVEDVKYNVGSQLPGLKESVASKYLTPLGYVVAHQPDCIRIGKRLNQRLQASVLFVETVVRRAPFVVVSVSLCEDRERVCCRRSFVAIHNQAASKIVFEAVRNKSHVETFLARVSNSFPSIITEET